MLNYFSALVLLAGVVTLFWPLSKNSYEPLRQMAINTDLEEAELKSSADSKPKAADAGCISLAPPSVEKEPVKSELVKTEPVKPEPVASSVVASNDGAANQGVTVLSIDYGRQPKKVIEILLEAGASLYRLDTEGKPSLKWDIYGNSWRSAKVKQLSQGEVRNVTSEASFFPESGPSILHIPQALWAKLTLNADGNTRLSLQGTKSPFGVSVATKPFNRETLNHHVVL